MTQLSPSVIPNISFLWMTPRSVLAVYDQSLSLACLTLRMTLKSMLHMLEEWSHVESCQIENSHTE